MRRSSRSSVFLFFVRYVAPGLSSCFRVLGSASMWLSALVLACVVSATRASTDPDEGKCSFARLRWVPFAGAARAYLGAGRFCGHFQQLFGGLGLHVGDVAGLWLERPVGGPWLRFGRPRIARMVVRGLPGFDGCLPSSAGSGRPFGSSGQVMLMRRGLDPGVMLVGFWEPCVSLAPRSSRLSALLGSAPPFWRSAPLGAVFSPPQTGAPLSPFGAARCRHVVDYWLFHVWSWSLGVTWGTALFLSSSRRAAADLGLWSGCGMCARAAATEEWVGGLERRNGSLERIAILMPVHSARTSGRSVALSATPVCEARANIIN
ncbi:hypothetical protein Hypma_003758 [Hypsizygus marmoreus]|uniref:Uncharacterized protein n=1 Tax=Hypsizygus marmoreus TaxID=39966 RepID=A0A369J164_HYPMA|nr:hypothetical protein Hypma_003758 [Hypsizygus marmoreus]